MIIRRGTSLRTFGSISKHFSRTQVRTVTIRLPPSLRKYEQSPSSGWRAGTPKGVPRREPRINQPNSEPKSQSTDGKDVPLRDRSLKPDKSVESYLDNKISQEKGLTLDPTSAGFKTARKGPLDHYDLFKYMPAYLSRAYIDPSAIFQLLPTLDQLLPPDPLNRDVKGPYGIQTLYSWSTEADEASWQHRQNVLHLGWTLPMYSQPIDPSSLLFDGTDARFLPGPENIWSYRLWSAGSIKSCTALLPRIHELRAPHHVVERPILVFDYVDTVKVTIQKTFIRAFGRRLGGLYNGPEMLRIMTTEPKDDLNDYNQPFASEEYSLIFFKYRPPTISPQYSKWLPPPTAEPEVSHSLVINRQHLFCWSGITQNAHLIHLDKDFARNEYGARDLLVQGPFTVFLILEWLRRVLTAKAVNRLDFFTFRQFNYKILSPIIVDESVRFCARPLVRAVRGAVSTRWQLWVEKSTSASPASTMLAFMGTLTVETQRWDGRPLDILAERISGPSETKPDNESSASSENNQTNADIESDEFQSPFFPR